MSIQDTDPPRASRRGTTNHVRLTVSDIPRARRFYDPLLDRLGYRLVEESDGRLAWAGWSGLGILQWFIVSVVKPHAVHQQHDRYATGLHHFAWNVDTRDEVDAFHALLLRERATVLDAPTEYDYEPGYYAVFFLDPDGIKLEVVHVPESGSLAYWTNVTGVKAP